MYFLLPFKNIFITLRLHNYWLIQKSFVNFDRRFSIKAIWIFISYKYFIIICTLIKLSFNCFYLLLILTLFVRWNLLWIIILLTNFVNCWKTVSFYFILTCLLKPILFIPVETFFNYNIIMHSIRYLQIYNSIFFQNTFFLLKILKFNINFIYISF